MLDETWHVKVRGTSPENEHVLVVQENGDNLSHNPGGAANVAVNLRGLGANVFAFGVLGEESCQYSQRLLQLLDQADVSYEVVRSVRHMLPVKRRIVSRSGQILRIDRERPVPAWPAWSCWRWEEHFTDKFNDLLKEEATAVVCLVDYDKGFFLGDATADWVANVIKFSGRSDLWVMLDPGHSWRWLRYNCPNIIFKANLRQAMAFLATDAPERATKWAKLEDGIFGPQTYCELICDVRLLLTQRSSGRVTYEYIWLTLGAAGSVFAGRQSEAQYVPASRRIEVADPCGAGDTALAAAAYDIAAHGLTEPAHMQRAVQRANQAASVVVQKRGVYAVSAEDLSREA